MSLDSLSDEIIQLLLRYLSPDDTLWSVQPVSRRFYSLANESLLWRYYCVSCYQYWHPRHDFPSKLRQRAGLVQWKSLYLERRRSADMASALFSSVITTRSNRQENMDRICRLGYDVKEFLADQVRTPDNVEDVLARRYFATKLLASIHRGIALKAWHEMRIEAALWERVPSPRQLERCLGALDMFVLHDDEGDLIEISRILDDIASQFRAATSSELRDATPREMALALSRWLRLHEWVGLRDPELNYRNLRNCFLGQTLRHAEHGSLPLISDAIYCCVAERVGIEAYCCNYPSHVFVVVNLNPEKPLAGLPIRSSMDDREFMYLDPFNSSQEVPVAGLRARFDDSTSPEAIQMCLLPCSTSALVNRLNGNINMTVLMTLEDTRPELTQLRTGEPSTNLPLLMYAMKWISLLIGSKQESPAQIHAAYGELTNFARFYPEDAWLFREYLSPAYPMLSQAFPCLVQEAPPGHDQPWFGLFLSPRPDPAYSRQQRLQGMDELVKYKIGQVFRHQRYRTLGVITGWVLKQKTTVSDDQEHVSNERKYVCYYECLQETRSFAELMIASESIELVTDSSIVDVDRFPGAGRYFKRFDAANCSFVSNVREKYPHD